MMLGMTHGLPHAPSDAPTSSTHNAIVPAALREPDAARYIARSRAFLKKSRLLGRGPDFVRTNRAITYRLVDLDRWLESHVVRLVQTSRSAVAGNEGR